MGPFQLWPSNWEVQIRSGKMGEDPHQRCNFSGKLMNNRTFGVPIFRKKHVWVHFPQMLILLILVPPAQESYSMNWNTRHIMNASWHREIDRQPPLNMVGMQWSKLLVNWFPCCVCWVITPMHHTYIYIHVYIYIYMYHKP